MESTDFGKGHAEREGVGAGGGAPREVRGWRETMRERLERERETERERQRQRDRERYQAGFRTGLGNR